MLARFSALRSFPRLVVVPVRHTSSKVEGSVAQSKEFSKKEAAHESAIYGSIAHSTLICVCR
ncbi:hypothetical protein H2248_002714 [Termitomyces sp. 'cryptogamus']|nr:hypothetical protein H2248_002714 [Termitomyces sp. 'cryptogamus']